MSGLNNPNFKHTDKEDLECIYKTYLDYCIQAWSPHLKKDKACLGLYREWQQDYKNSQKPTEASI